MVVRVGDDPEVAIEVTCPICKQGPGEWCVYVGQSVRAGTPTLRLHVERTHQYWLLRPEPMGSTTKPNVALSIHRETVRREDRALRDWLRRYVHLLLKLN